VIVAVPALTPDTTPPADTEATPDALLLQVPAGLALASAVVLPTHTVGVPVIGSTEALAFTVAVDVTEQDTPDIVAVAVYIVVDAGPAYTVLVIVPAIYGVVSAASIYKPAAGDHV
jgi:hypothetical protein